MSERKPLLVIVTRAYKYSPNEWVETWKFDNNKEKAYVFLKKVVFDNFSKGKKEEYDILIINGSKYTTNPSSLFKLVWDEVKGFEKSRDIHIRVHLHNLKMEINQWLPEGDAKQFLKLHAEEYNLGDPPSNDDDPYVKLANVVLKIRNNPITVKVKEYQDVIFEVIRQERATQLNREWIEIEKKVEKIIARLEESQNKELNDALFNEIKKEIDDIAPSSSSHSSNLQFIQFIFKEVLEAYYLAAELKQRDVLLELINELKSYKEVIKGEIHSYSFHDFGTIFTFFDDLNKFYNKNENGILQRAFQNEDFYKEELQRKIPQFIKGISSKMMDSKENKDVQKALESVEEFLKSETFKSLCSLLSGKLPDGESITNYEEVVKFLREDEISKHVRNFIKNLKVLDKKISLIKEGENP